MSAIIEVVGGQAQPNNHRAVSSVTPACGTWLVNKLTHQLDTLVPHGKWFTTMECSNPNNPGAAPRPTA